MPPEASQIPPLAHFDLLEGLFFFKTRSHRTLDRFCALVSKGLQVYGMGKKGLKNKTHAKGGEEKTLSPHFLANNPETVVNLTFKGGLTYGQ